MIMAIVQDFDELNNLSFAEYFGEIVGITDDQKNVRVKLANKFLDIFLLGFSCAEEMFRKGTSDVVIEQELWDTFEEDILAAIPDEVKYAYLSGVADEVKNKAVDPALKNHVSLITASIAAYTVANIESYYATSYERAWRAAADESISVWNYGDFKMAVADGKTHKTWHTILDEKTRVAHWLVNGKTVRINDYFVVGGEAMRYPHDINASAENVINCRCSVSYS